MTAWQRSDITTRREKGIGAVSFKRLLIAGGVGAIVALIGGRTVGFFPSCVGAGLVLGLVLAITHPVEGMPLIVFGLRSLRGLAAVAAVTSPGSARVLGRALQVTPEDGVLQGDVVFDTTWADEMDGDLLDGDYEYLGRFADAQREGLSAAANPFRKGVDR